MTSQGGRTIQDREGLFQAALALHRAGRLGEAADAYARVSAAYPEFASAYTNRGVALRRLGRLEEALACCDRAIALTPDAPNPHNNRGRVLRDLKRPEEALASYDRALALAPNDADLHAGRAAALYDLGRLAEAVEAYDRALSLQPGQVAVLRDRATTLRGLGRMNEALDSLERAIALRPDSADLHRYRGLMLEAAGRPEEALASLDRAVALAPNLAAAHNGRGAALVALGRLTEALEAYDRAIALAPDFALAYRNRGVTLRRLRRPEAAVAAYDHAIALQPDLAESYWYRALCHLLIGRFAEGWLDYERRWEVDDFTRTGAGKTTPDIRARFDRTLDVAGVTGRNVLLVGEQGVGDEIMFASLIPDLAAVAGQVSLVCDPRLERLFAASFPFLRLLDTKAVAKELADFDAVMGIGGLGRLFRNRLADFPGVPYLTPGVDRIQAWRDRLGPADGLKRVGLSWRGGLARTGRLARSLDLEQLRPVLDLPGCEFVSLQYGDHTAEIAAVNAASRRPIRDFPAADIDNFADLAGLVANMDLVVSVQTSLVHLTGALGKPGLVMVPALPEWRYGESGETMPWYHSIRLFRQTADEDWSPVVRDVAAAAAQHAQQLS